jgi:hypothetical protein
VKFIPHHPRASLVDFGYIPLWLSEANPKPAAQQLNDGYAYGGWQPFQGFILQDDDGLKYPGDPPIKPICELLLRQERIVLYPSSWVAVIQPDRSFEVCRLD